MGTNIAWKTTYKLSTDDNFIKAIWDKHPELAVYTRKEIWRMLVNFNKYTSSIITGTRDGVTLPYYMGAMFLATYGKRETTIDKPTSEAIGKEVTYLNHHSDGYGGRIYYVTDIVRNRFKDGKYWGFLPCPQSKVECSNAYKTNWKKYVHVPNSYYAAKVFRRAKLKEYAQAKGRTAEELYNEFDFD